MHFQIEPMEDTDGASYTWKLCTADGTVLAAAPNTTATQDEARKQIATFRKSAGGVRFAKVLS